VADWMCVCVRLDVCVWDACLDDVRLDVCVWMYAFGCVCLDDVHLNVCLVT
jgi:hypothetical protein